MRTAFRLALAGILLAGATAAFADVERANGSGHFTPPNQDQRTFSFAAVQRADGSFTGQGQLSRSDGAVLIHFTIDCLDIVGNVATMSGTITQTNVPDPWPGCPVWVRVEDNGPGGSSTPDRITLLYCFVEHPSDPPDCHEQIYDEYGNPVALVPVDGNVTVH